MQWDRKRLLGYVETIQLILGVTDKHCLSYGMMTLHFLKDVANDTESTQKSKIAS